MDFNSWNFVWSFCFGSLAGLIAVGNSLTIWIFLKQRLRKRAHFLLISLAVADLLVGLLTVPLYIAISTLLYLGRPHHLVWSVYGFTDILIGLTSIYTLAVISLERMYAIVCPFRHRTLNFRVYISAIIIPWILAATFTSLDVMRFLNVVTRESLLYPIIVFQSTPLLVMCTAYCIIWKKQKSPIGNQAHTAREAKLATTLFIITGASLLTWLPFQVFNALLPFDAIGSFSNFNSTVYAIKFLQFSNSLVNVLIYPFRISQFKNELLQMLHCRVIIFHKRNVVQSHRVRMYQLHHLPSTAVSQL